SPLNGSLLNTPQFRAAIQVESFAGPMTLTVNGEAIALNESNNTLANIKPLLSFSSGQNMLALTVSATDSLDRTSTLNASFTLDDGKPIITLNDGLQPEQVNPVTQSPYTMS